MASPWCSPVVGTSGTDGDRTVNRRNVLRVLLVASATLLFVDLGGSSIWDANEAFYVETPRQMVLTGDYVSPTFNGEPRFNKPVLSYWIVAGVYKVLGVSVASERLAIAFGALMLIAATFVIGRTIANTDTGVLAALILASAPRVMLWSRRIFIDIYFTSFLAVALMGLVLARSHPEHRRRYLVVMYVALGLAMLTKGPAALVFPGLVLFVFLLWNRQLSEIKTLMLPAGLLIVAAIVMPWYVMLYLRDGWKPINDFFIGENIGRFTETYGLQHRPPYFYVGVLLTDLTPWALFLPAGLWAAWRAREPQMRLLIVWIAVFVGAFTLSSTKQDLYIFPIVPAVAVVIASVVWREIDQGVDSTGIRALLRVGGGVTALALVLVGGWLVWLARIAHLVPELPQTAIVGAALAAGGICAAICVVRGRMWPTVVALGATAVVTNWLLVTVMMRPFEQFKPVPPMAAWINAHSAPTTVVAHYKMPLPSLTYYLGRPVKETFDIETITKLMAEQSSMYVVLQPLEYEELSRSATARLCVIEKRARPLFDAKVRDIVARKLPEVWLAGVNDACR